MNPRSARSTALSFLLLAGSALADNGGGFAAGDAYLVTTAFLPGGAWLARVNPYSGATTPVLSMPVWSSVFVRTLAYDPYRDRLILQTQTTTSNTSYGLWAFDAQGGGTMIAAPDPGNGNPWNGVAPTGDGRLYLLSPSSTAAPLYWLDSGNQRHTLLNAAGTAPFQLPPASGSYTFLAYDAASNALFTLTQANAGVCSGGSTFAVNIHKVTLSPDGTRGIATWCTQHLPLANTATGQIGLSPGPAGSLMLAVHADSPTSPIPTLVRIDPQTLALSPFASPSGGTSGIRMTGAVYSHATNRVLATEYFGTIHGIGTGQTAGGVALTGQVIVSGGPDTALVEIGTPGNPEGLTASIREISLAAGGTQNLSLSLGSSYAGHVYFLLGSITGHTPGFNVGSVHVPLGVDSYLMFTLSNPNTLPLSSSVGFLNGQGAGASSFSLPAHSDPVLAGLRLHHAAILIAPNLAVEAATNPVALLLVP